MPQIKPRNIIFGEIDRTHHIMIAGEFYHVNDVFVGADEPYAIMTFGSDADDTNLVMKAHLQKEVTVYTW